jgi:hypothetical protein
MLPDGTTAPPDIRRKLAEILPVPLQTQKPDKEVLAPSSKPKISAAAASLLQRYQRKTDFRCQCESPSPAVINWAFPPKIACP